MRAIIPFTPLIAAIICGWTTFRLARGVWSLLGRRGPGGRWFAGERALRRLQAGAAGSVPDGGGRVQAALREALRLGRHRTVLGAVLGLATGLMVGGAGIALVAMAGGIVATARENRRRAERARAEFSRQLEQAILLLVASLSGNQTLLQACGTVGREVGAPLGGIFAAIAQEYQTGVPLAQCLRKATQSTRSRDFSHLVQAIELQRRSGGDLVTVLGHVVSAIRERRLMRGELAARTSEARLTADVLILATAALALYFLLFQPDALRPLTETTTGRLALAYAAGSWATGLTVMGRLLRMPELEDAP
jgi:tight adherence protein B